MEQGGNRRRAEGDDALYKALEQSVQEVGGLGGEALLDALRRDKCTCQCRCLCPVGVGGAGIAGSAEDNQLGEGGACEFALALDEACFLCEGVGVVFENLLEGVLDLYRETGCVAHSVSSVPFSGAVLKLMPMGLRGQYPLCEPV